MTADQTIITNDVQDFDAQEDTTAPVEPKQAAPAAPAVDPREVAAHVAAILQSTPGPQKSAVQAELERLIGQGYSPEALEVIARIRAAERADEQREQVAQAQQYQAQQFQASIWQMALDSFETFAEQIPALEDAKESTLRKFHQTFHTDPEFRDELAKVNAGQLPNKRAINKAMGKTVDAFCKRAGIQKPALPVDLRANKPQATGTKGGGVESLDPSQRKLFNALKGVVGADRALEHAKALHSD